MAEQLDSFSFLVGNSARYPWNSWLNGKAWKLRNGSDFRGSLVSFRSNCYIRAEKAGLHVRTEIVSDSEIVIQAFKQEHRDG